MDDGRPAPALEPADYAPMNTLFIDPAVLDALAMPMPQSVQGYREFAESARGVRGVGPGRDDLALFVIERVEDREAIGICALEEIESRSRSAMLGIWVGKPPRVREGRLPGGGHAPAVGVRGRALRGLPPHGPAR